MKLNKMIGSKVRRIAVTIVVVLAAMFATSAALATDLENYYFRYDFSDGTKQFIGSASQTSDPITADADAANFVSAYGQDGSSTAVHVNSNAYGTDTIGGSKSAGKTVLAAGWTLAMSLRPGSVNKGILFSLGRANENGCKAMFLASSSSSGKFYVGTARKVVKSGKYEGSNRELAHEWELTTSADLTTGYHAIVAVHTNGGSVKIYIDGELAYIGDDPTATAIDTTLNCNAATCVFGNGIQFNQAHGSSTFLSANGYSQSLNNPDVAFQDVRFYNSAFTAEDVAAYAALYPATLPGFSDLDQYAYVQSYGVNGVDTGVYMTDTDKFIADFAFTDVSYKSWLCGAGKNANKQTHAIYLNGNQQLAWTTRGEWWWSTWPSAKIEGSTIEDTRLVMTVESSLTANLTYYDTRETKSSDASSKTATSTGPSIIPTHLFRANSMVEEAGQECKAKIYSFEVDADSSAITPRAFFAPTTDGNGAAGFTNVVAGTFHGECQTSPSTALTFTSGVGRAEDYRYRSGKFYSRIYASSADSGTGLVKFDGGEAAGTNAQFTARGRTAKIIAVPAEGYTLDRWEGDTWAITSGLATSTNITVKSDTAIQLRATFVAKSEADALLTVAADGAGSINWSEADWRDIENSEAQIPYPTDKNVTIVAHKSFTLTLDVAVALSNLTVRADTNCIVTLTKGDGSLLTVETIVASGILKQGSASVLGTTPKVTVENGGTFDFNAKNINGAMSLYLAGAGAGDWPWALTSTGGVPGEYVHNFVLTTNATIGSAASSQLKVGYASSSSSRGSLTLDGHTLTVTGGMWLTFRKLKTPGTGTILYNGRGTGIYESALNTEEGETTLILGDGVTEGVTVNNPVSIHALEWRGKTLNTSSAALTVKSSLTGYGTTAKLSFADGTTAVLEGDLTVPSAMTAAGALSLTRAAGVETNVTVAATGTLTASGTLTVGTGVALSGSGTVDTLVMESGTVFKPTGTDYLNVTNTLSGTVTVDLSGLDFAGRTATVPLLKVPTSLADTARTALNLPSIPRGWKLSVREDGDENICFTIVKKGVIIVVH